MYKYKSQTLIDKATHNSISCTYRTYWNENMFLYHLKQNKKTVFYNHYYCYYYYHHYFISITTCIIIIIIIVTITIIIIIIIIITTIIKCMVFGIKTTITYYNQKALYTCRIKLRFNQCKQIMKKPQTITLILDFN